MNFKKITSKTKEAWDWVWNSDSIWSWIIAFILIWMFMKFLFFPSLSLILGTSLPLAGVESSSMDHQMISDGFGNVRICGKIFNKKSPLNFDEYWNLCGRWYEERNITKKQFSEFPLKNGFKKGDVIIVWGRFKPKIGDIIIFKSSSLSAPHPIIHRIVKINPDGSYQTKGDHNEGQLIPSNNLYNTDETHITHNQIIGKALIKIPYLGYPKIWLSRFIQITKYTLFG